MSIKESNLTAVVDMTPVMSVTVSKPALTNYLAGSIGLEPILYATKKRCITIMLRPNVKAVYADFKYRASQKIVILTCFVPCMLLGEKYEKI